MTHLLPSPPPFFFKSFFRHILGDQQIHLSLFAHMATRNLGASHRYMAPRQRQTDRQVLLAVISEHNIYHHSPPGRSSWLRIGHTGVDNHRARFMPSSVMMVSSALSMELNREEEKQPMPAVNQINVAVLRMSQRYCMMTVLLILLRLFSLNFDLVRILLFGDGVMKLIFPP